MHPRHQPINTEDGSPSLSTTYDSGITERMHHFRGALTESVYVYLPAIEWALKNRRSAPCHVMSLGLGLGYNELLAAGAAVRAAADLTITTFEIDPELRGNFTRWLTGTLSDPEWAALYDSVGAATAKALDLRPEDLKAAARELIESGVWRIRGAFPESLDAHDRFHAILYDAFSAKMDGPLWREENLLAFLQRHAAPACAFATYAANGALKRALKGAGFRREFKAGFGGKKESTFAERG
jgi:tRNA U34 5-methylaminomethyl-2-thiouridine-forming methyltransferase MnmC